MPNTRHKRESRIELRVSHEALCQKAASIQGLTLTDFVVEAAKRTIRENEFIELTQRDRTAFVEALLNPPSPNANLLDAMAKQAKVVVS